MPHHNFNPALSDLEMAEWKKIEDASRKGAGDVEKKLRGLQLGATGRYPQGKLGPDDEGELAYAVAVIKERVIFDFGTPIRSLGLTADDAEELGEWLLAKAAEIRGGV